MKGFIALEGCEGVGKSTQLSYLKKYLDRTGQDAVFTREPGGTPLAEKIRTAILTEKMSAPTEAALFAAARCDHVDNLILPSLRADKLVVCDRYIDSSFAYQGYARGLGEEYVRAVNRYAIETCLPEAVIFLDMHPNRSWRKRQGVSIENDRIEQEAEAFHAAVYRGFCALAEKNPAYIRIQADSDADVVAQNIVNSLRERGVIR